MKKRISLLLLFLFTASFLFLTGGNSAEASDLTAQQKFDALKAKGIFAGMADGTSQLDQNMNRAQFARVAALILGLEGIGTPDTKVVTEKPFKDVELGEWYVEEITALKEADIMVGNPDGTFNPNKDMTIQEMAVATARILDIGPEQDANVEGAANWAGPYIQSLLDAGIDFPTNYAEAAKRSDLVSIAYQADTIITLENENKKEMEELRKEEELKQEEELESEEELKKEEEAQSWIPVPQPVQAAVRTPEALPAGGNVTSGTPVTLTSATVSAVLYYTTDLSEPNTSSTPYTEPIIITSNTTIKAIAVKPGLRNSSVARFDFTVTMPIVLPDSISSATEGQPYTASVAKLSGGMGAVTYTVTSGTLPAGLSLDSSTGELSGTPSVNGEYHFTISATDSATPPATATMQYTISITPANIKTPLELINEASALDEWSNIDETTFADADITGITSENLFNIRYYLMDPDKTTDFPLPRTSADIQAIVDEMIQDMAVSAIYSYLESSLLGPGEEARPTVEIFARAGITRVDASNLDAILDELGWAYEEAKWDMFGTPMSTKQDIQDVIDRFLTV